MWYSTIVKRFSSGLSFSFVYDAKYTYFHKSVFTCSRSLSWWPMMAEAWWGYFCFRCSKKASRFLSISEGFMARISCELRAPPTVCLRGTPARLDLASQRLPGLLAETTWCLRARCSASSLEVTFRFPFRGSREKRQRCNGMIREKWENMRMFLCGLHLHWVLRKSIYVHTHTHTLNKLLQMSDRWFSDGAVGTRSIK